MATRRPAARLASTTSRALSTSCSGSSVSLHFESHADARDRLCGNAFAPPGEAEPFGRRGLYADLVNAQTCDFGDSRAHGRPMRTDLGRFGDDRAVDVIDHRTPGAKQFDGVCQEQRGGAPFHCGSDGGKCSPMSPRPAAPSSASVIAWRTTSASLCPASPRLMRHLHAAEHDRTLAGESMNVEAHAGARDQASGEPLLGALEIGGRVSFSSAGSPSTAATLHSGCTNHRGLVGRGGARPRLIGRPSALEAKCLGVWTRTRPCDRRARRASRRPAPAYRRPAARARRLRKIRAGEQPIDDARGQKGRAASGPARHRRRSRPSPAAPNPRVRRRPDELTTSKPARASAACSCCPSPITTRVDCTAG